MRRYWIHFVCAAGFAVSLSADPPKRAATDFVPVEITSLGTWDSGAYAYDGAGNIKAIGANTYQYDTAGRLVSGNVNGTGFRQDYNYDAFGNRILSTTTPPFACVGGIACEENVTIQALTNHINSAANAPAYDDAGNLTALDGVTYTYDSMSMLRKQSNTGAQFLYTVDDERIATIQNASWNWTVRGLDGKVLRVFTSQDGSSLGAANFQWSKDYVYRGESLLAAQSSSVTEHFHLDHLGTPRLITDANAAEIAAHSYFPFGAELSLTPVESAVERMKFTGHERDFTGSVGDLDYMHARYCSPTLGRSFSVDPGRDWDPHNPQSWNSYTYARNNPILLTDPDGRFIKEIFDYFHRLFRQKLDAQHPPAQTDTTDPNYQALTDSQSGAPPEQAAYLTNKPGVVQGAVNEAHAIVGAAGVTAGLLVAAEVVTSAAAHLGQTALDHIVYRHWATSGFINVGRFAPGTTARSLRTMIDTASTLGKRTADRLGRTRIEVDFGKQIGVDMAGRAATRLRVIINHNGEVVTAFPIR